MGESRPRLWIVGGAGLPAGEVQRRLADLFEVTLVPPALIGDVAINAHSDFVLSRGDEVARGANPSTQALGPAGDALEAIEALAQGVALASPSGEVSWANARFRALPDDVRKLIAEVCRGAERLLGDAMLAHSVHRQEITTRSEDDEGETLEVSVTSSGADLAVVVRDITGDRRLRQKIDAIDQAGASLVSLNAETVRKVNAVERLKMLQNRIVSACVDLLKFDHFLIRVLDERTGKLEMIMHSGLPQEAVELEIRPAIEGNGISGYVAATGRSYICYDTHQDRRFLPGFSNARSSLTIPLRLHDKVIGIFNVESDRVGAFSEDDRQFAEIFSRYVAIALHMLNLLVVERSATSETFSGRVEGELSAPLEDILKEADWLKELANRDQEAAGHVQRIITDVDAIRKRVKNVASGAQTLLGVEGALTDVKIDPLLLGKVILVADDEANVRRIIHDVLHKRGAEVCTFPNGLEAIEALEGAAAGLRPGFDVVLSDIRMPDRNGYEVFAAARKTAPGLPVILMTGFGYDPHHSIVRASQEGLQNVLFKPFPVDRLIEEVKKAVSRSPAT
jgi:CheY-like chemotaxis protein